MKKISFLLIALLVLTAPLFAEEIVGTKPAGTEETKITETAEAKAAETSGTVGTKGSAAKAAKNAKKTKHSYKPKEGYVPSGAVAIAIAEAVLTPIYGAETLAKEKPLTAQLRKGAWIVKGTLACPTGNRCVGGVVEARISKDNGRILRVSHGK